MPGKFGKYRRRSLMTCDYCGREYPTKQVKVVSGGRVICPNCKGKLTPEQKQELLDIADMNRWEGQHPNG